MSFWEWFDGKKTAIGAVAMVLAKVGQEVMIGVWGLDAMLPWLPQAIETCSWIGAAVTTFGIGHKAVKARNGNDEPAP